MLALPENLAQYVSGARLFLKVITVGKNVVDRTGIQSEQVVSLDVISVKLHHTRCRRKNAYTKKTLVVQRVPIFPHPLFKQFGSILEDRNQVT